MRLFIAQGSALGGAVNLDIPKGKYAGLLIRIFGTTNTGQTLALSDIGQLRVNRHGKEVISESFDFFHCYDDLKGGFLPTVTGGAAAAEDVFCLIPFALPELPNVMNVLTNEEADLRLDFDTATMNTRFGANPCTYQVYGYMTPDIDEHYQLLIREQDVQATGAGRLSDALNGSNLAALYLIDDSDVIDSYSLAVDGSIVVDNIDDDVERAVTSFENSVEAANRMAEVNLVRTGNFANAINGVAKIELVFNAGGTVNLTAFQISKVTAQ